MFVHDHTFDVIVVGAGHAGTEAATAATRMGASVLMLTANMDRVGWMSCNPAIGGLGKTQLVREVDALGGLMARATDASGIQYRLLNTRKGPAVRATRVQCDKGVYAASVRQRVEQTDGLTLKQASVERLVVEGEGASRIVAGVDTGLGIRYLGRAVIITAGTFMRGLCHYGETKVKGGRAGDKASYGLSASLAELDLRMGRLKTGTVPRLDGRTIDWERLEVQPGADPPEPVAAYGSTVALRQVPCHVTRTNSRTHDVIRANLHRSPMFSGDIEGTGPRYCPSIEDKVVRFAERDAHKIFLEPEGLETTEVYPNGISTSLPIDAQIDLVRTIEGLESAEITRPGYAVEYDFVDPRQLTHGLQVRGVAGLFLAGQVNGTSGYEEAAIQGLVAGANAVLHVREEQPFVLDRSEAYGGVLVDDLVTRGADEPYRMFTSRAEYRLALREDNADDRLMPRGRAIGLVADDTWAAFERRRDAVNALVTRLNEEPINPSNAVNDRLRAEGIGPISTPLRLCQLLRRKDVTAEALGRAVAPWLLEADPIARRKAALQARYAAYIERQDRQIARHQRLEQLELPGGLDYAAVHGLTTEASERLSAASPRSIGHASRLQGITPAAINALMIHLDKRRLRTQNAAPKE